MTGTKEKHTEDAIHFILLKAPSESKLRQAAFLYDTSSCSNSDKQHSAFTLNSYQGKHKEQDFSSFDNTKEDILTYFSLSYSSWWGNRQKVWIQVVRRGMLQVHRGRGDTR